MTTAEKQARIRELSDEYRRLKMTTPTETSPTPGAVVVRAGQHAMAAGVWTNREADLIASALSPSLRGNMPALQTYSAICKHTGLDPFKKQIYAWMDKGKLTIHIAVGGWRQMAAKTGLYRGQVGPFWCGPDGKWVDVWLAKEPPAAARVGIRRSDTDDVTYATVTWSEFQRTKARTGAQGPTVWDEKPSHMLAVRAEYHALQKALPEIRETFDEVRPADYGVTVEVTDEEPTPVLIEAAEPLGEGEAENREGSGNAPAPPAEREVSAPAGAGPGAAPSPAATVPSGDGSTSVGAESGAPPDAVADLPLPANSNADGAMDWWYDLGVRMKNARVVEADMRAALKGVFSLSNAIQWCRKHQTNAAGLVAAAKQP